MMLHLTSTYKGKCIIINLRFVWVVIFWNLFILGLQIIDAKLCSTWLCELLYGFSWFVRFHLSQLSLDVGYGLGLLAEMLGLDKVHQWAGFSSFNSPSLAQVSLTSSLPINTSNFSKLSGFFQDICNLIIHGHIMYNKLLIWYLATDEHLSLDV